MVDGSLLPDGRMASSPICLCLGWLASSVCGPGMTLTWWEVRQEGGSGLPGISKVPGLWNIHFPLPAFGEGSWGGI